MQQHAGQRQTLLHAPRERIDLRVDLVRQIGQLQHVVDDGRPSSAGDAVGGREKVQVFADGQVLVDAEEVGHVADVLADGLRVAADVDPVDFGPPAVVGQAASPGP